MKKLSYLFVLLFALSFVACTDNYSEDEETNTILSVDRGEIERPGDQGNTGG